jgi:4'-phosphopantetheinyl transferase EntD
MESQYLLSKTLRKLILPLELEQKALVHQIFPHTQSFHPHRLSSFYWVRQCLLEILAQEGYEVTFSDLASMTYHRHPLAKEILFSLSHTQDSAMAIALKTTEVKAIGLDIEHPDRIIKQAGLKFFSHPEDHQFEDNLKLWSIKEAAFKALSALVSIQNLAQISVHQDGRFFAPQYKLQGNWSFIKTDLNYAYAFIK